MDNLDLEKSFYDQLDEYEVNGYAVKDLKPSDRPFVEGFAFAIDCVDQYEPDIDTGSEKMDEIVEEYVEQVMQDIVTHMLSGFSDLLFSIMDNDEDYYER